MYSNTISKGNFGLGAFICDSPKFNPVDAFKNILINAIKPFFNLSVLDT